MVQTPAGTAFNTGVVKRPTYTPLRWELEHRQQVVGALLQVGGSKALRGESCEAGQQRDDCTPDQPLLALSEAQHSLDYFTVPCQHELTCAHKRNSHNNNNYKIIMIRIMIRIVITTTTIIMIMIIRTATN